MIHTVENRPAELWTAAQSAAADRHTMDVLGMPSPVLMERAALGVAQAVSRVAERPPVLCLCGPGNNGGDGYAVARLCKDVGLEAYAWAALDQMNEAAAEQRRLAERYGVVMLDDLPEEVAGWTIVDALLGTGSRGAPRARIADALVWLEAKRDASNTVIAVDIPTGIDPDRGTAAEHAVRATLTVTFQRSKPGLHVGAGREHAGIVVIEELGIHGPEAEPSRTTLIDPAWVGEALQRAPARHKGERGHVAVVGGGAGTLGAAVLAGRAAMRAGAGLLTVCTEDPAALSNAFAAAMSCGRDEMPLASSAHALVVGPGSVPEDAEWLAACAREDGRPAIWDASVLRGLAPEVFAAAKAPRVLTPHPGEAAAMLALGEPDHEWSTGAVQAERLAAARRLAELTRATVVLKGEGTIVADGERIAICVGGDERLATAGSGDVLAGVVGAYLARGLDAWTAACAAVHMHAMAGEISLEGCTADELADAVARVAKPAWPQRWPV